ncbi:MAG: hypothetical protein U0798_18855 [Gemmataceae bacterium]
MAQINQEALKKHHFWIVAGLVPLLTLIAVMLIWTGAGSAIAAGADLIAKAITSGKGTNPKGKWILGKLEDQKGVVAAKKDKLWEFNWNDQKELFTWPVDDEGKLKNFLRDPKDPNYAKDPSSAMIMKFGSPLPNSNFEFNAFKDNNVYRKAFENEAKSMEPTQFNGGSWMNVMRFVPNWTDKLPESWMIWLALEDYWVQRGMLEPIRTVTKQTAQFTPIVENGPDGKPLPAGLKRSFVSRIWQVDLEVKSEGPRRYLTAKIKNLTDRVQLLGIGNIMTLNVYFDNQVVPFEFRIEGEYIESGLKEATQVRYIPLYHDIPPNISPTAIARVEQVFDARTVPVKRIDRMLVGKTGNRHITATLKKATFVPEDPAAAAAAAPGGEGVPGGGPGGGPSAGMPSKGGRTMGPGMDGGTGTAAGLEGIFQDYRMRYLEVTDQVRRTPVAIVMVVDSMYLQDVLSAYSNSKLRFQVSQFHYKRFHDKLAMPNPSSESGGFGGFGSFGSSGTMYSGDFGTPEGGGSLMGRSKGMGMGMGMGMGGPPGLPGAGGPGVTMGGAGGRLPGGVVSSGGTTMGGMGGMGGMSGGFGMMGSSGVAESQTAAGLIELTIYGVVSLYDRFGTTPGADGATTGTTTPASTTPTTTLPGTTTPASTTPAVTPPGNPPATGTNPAPTTTPGNPNNSTPPAPTSPATTPSTPMTPGKEGNPPSSTPSSTPPAPPKPGG